MEQVDLSTITRCFAQVNMEDVYSVIRVFFTRLFQHHVVIVADLVTVYICSDSGDRWIPIRLFPVRASVATVFRNLCVPDLSSILRATR